MADPNTDAHKADEESAAERSETPAPEEVEATRAAEQSSFQSTVDIGDPDEPPSGGMQQGGNHTKWEEKDKIYGQGAKTLAAQRAQQKRST